MSKKTSPAPAGEPAVVPQQNEQKKDDISQVQPTAQGNLTAITDLIEKKTTVVTEEVTILKKEIESFKDNIEQIKSELKQATSTFESSLVELKSFQAEMINPINFMRKYIETLEIKNLSDPANTLKPVENLANISNNPSKSAASGTAIAQTHEEAQNYQNRESGIKQFTADHRQPSAKQSRTFVEDDDDSNGNFSSEKYQDYQMEARPVSHTMARKNIMPLQRQATNNLGQHSQMIAESVRLLTPGKIMSIVSMVDEILATMGPDGIELIVEQYRALGMKPEEERLIYGVLRMLNETKLLTDDIIAMFYRFGQVLGINDEEAELQYMKLIASRRTGSRKSNPANGRKNPVDGDR